LIKLNTIAIKDDPKGHPFLFIPLPIGNIMTIPTIRRHNMNLPIIHTNIWDAIIAIPFIILITQVIKLTLNPPAFLVPNIAVILGLLISIFISHRGQLVVGIFMGFFYGYAAIGNYASLKTTIPAYRKQREIVE
jgi:hypothetical protein